MKKIITIKKILFLVSIITLSGCFITRTSRFAKCDFNYKELVVFKANGIDLLSKNSASDLSASESLGLTKALAIKNLPVDIQLNLEVENPNSGKAVLNTVDWVLQINKKDVVSGTTNQRVEVAPNGGKALLPIKANFNALKMMDDFSFSEIMTAFWSVSNNPKNPDVFTVKIKPAVQIARQQIKYPGYINIKY